MSRQHQPPQEPWENDPVWKLLEASPRYKAGPRFVDDVARLARMDQSPKPWWKGFFSPVPLTGVAVASAVAAFAVFATITLPDGAPNSAPLITDFSSDIDLIEEAVEMETLLAAVDHMDDFSDAELVRLIGF
jgi:hypothetical protein